MESNSNVSFETAVGKHQIVLKTFITGFEKDSITAAYLDSKNLPMSQQLQAAKKRAFEVTVMSVDGHADNVFDRIQNFDHRDAAEIKERIDEITEGKKKD